MVRISLVPNIKTARYLKNVFADQDRLLQSFPTRPIRLKSGVIAIFGKINVLIDEALLLVIAKISYIKLLVIRVEHLRIKRNLGFLIVDCR